MKPIMMLAVLTQFLLAAGPALAAGPKTRPFHMALTPANFDDSAEGTQRMTKLLADHADVVAVYLDYGVPWPEAFSGEPFHENVRKEIAAIRQRISPGHRVFLALNAGAFTRREMAGYWGESPMMPRPGSWANKTFDDPEIITAFGNYCERMIQTFKPDYLCYAIEVNMPMLANPEAFKSFPVLAEKLYARLKNDHPGLLVFVTIQIDFHHGARKGGEEILRKLLPFSDAVAVSTYPHIRGFTPDTLPVDWFSGWRDLAPEKPFIIAETGFPADIYDWNWFNQPVKVQATPAMQAAYVTRILGDARRLDAELITWFFPEDINAHLKRQVDARAKELGKKPDDPAITGLVAMARNVGLSDERHQARLAMAEWDRWFGFAVNRERTNKQKIVGQ